MKIDDLIGVLQRAKEGSAILDLLYMKIIGEAPEDAEPTTNGMLWCVFHSILDNAVGTIKPRTSRYWFAEYYYDNNWTSMSKKGFPKIDEWTAEINGPNSGLIGVHKYLSIAMTIAALREYKESEKLS